MAYNPYTDVNSIYKLKGEWDAADKRGDAAAKNDAAAKAKEYYSRLKQNGYENAANELSASDYTRAKAVKDKWAKFGKTSASDYFYSLGKSRGMSKADVDGLLGYDADTGELSFGGKKLGAPDAYVNGTAYFTDTKPLDTAFDDYTSRSGSVRARASAVNAENENLFKKYNREYEDLKNENPFTTEVGRSILSKYDLAALQGRDNQAAGGAADNGGNIDSFAAANALRQQAALISQGQTAALEAHKQKLDHARALLSDMGVNIDRVFNQEETAKNNQLARDVQTSEVTGTVPQSMLYDSPLYSRFFNSDGTLKNPDIDYKAEIEKADAAGNAELARVLRAARGAKIYGDFAKYGKYAADGDYTLPGSTPTEAARRFDAQLTAERENQKAQLAAERQNTLDQIALSDRQLAAERAENAAERQNRLDQIVAKTLYGTESGSETNSKQKTDKSDGEDKKQRLTAGQAKAAYDSGIRTKEVLEAYAYYYGEDAIQANTNSKEKELSLNELLGLTGDPSKTPDQNQTPDPRKKTSVSSPLPLTSTRVKGFSGESPIINTKAPLDDNTVKAWVNTLNNDAASIYGGGAKALKQTAPGQYTPADVDPNYIIVSVFGSDELTQAQKEYLLCSKFGITEAQIRSALGN